MKKVLCLFLCVYFLVGLTGCGENDISYETSDDSYEMTDDSYEAPEESDEVSLSQFRPTAKEYAYIIKELHPEINSYTLAHDDGEFVMYSDTGLTGGNYSDVWMYSEKTFVFTDGTGNGEYSINYFTYSGLVVVTDDTGADLRTMLRDALAWFNGYPLAPTADELINLFNENAKTTSGVTQYIHTQDNITYQIVISNAGYTTVRIEL